MTMQQTWSTFRRGDAESCLSAVSYFGFLQCLYTFFSASTYRWDKLKNALPSHALFVKKYLSGTRWSA